MPGVGKSTVGVLLAKAMGMDFVDTDIVIQNQCKCTLQTVIDRDGIDAFIALENRVVSELSFDNAVIATGGSVVYGSDAMENLKKHGKIVYLNLECDELLKRLSNIKTRGVAMKPGQTLENLFMERDVLYKKYADVIIDENGLSIEDTVKIVMENCSIS